MQYSWYALVTSANPADGSAGFHSRASPCLPQKRTLPVGSTWACTARMLVANGVPHFPRIAAAFVPAGAKAAYMVRASFIVSWQVPVPLQGVDQPANVCPVEAVAVRVTTLPAGYEAEHPVAAAVPEVIVQLMAG